MVWLIRRREAFVGMATVLLIAAGALAVTASRTRAGGRSGLRPALSKLPQGRVITAVQTQAPEVAITFDDGPDPTYTPAVLGVLRRFGAVGTFFVLGSQVERFPSLAQRLVAEGSQVCNHGYAHERLRGRSAAFVRANVARAARVLARLGLPHCNLFRFPYFLSDTTARTAVLAMGYRIVAAGCDSSDYQMPPAAAMAQRVLHCVRPGAIILFHDAGGNRRRTVEALRLVLEGLRALHLQPVTLGQLLESGAASVPSSA